MNTFHIYYNSCHVHTIRASNSSEALESFNRKYPFYNFAMVSVMEVYVP